MIFMPSPAWLMLQWGWSCWDLYQDPSRVAHGTFYDIHTPSTIDTAAEHMWPTLLARTLADQMPQILDLSLQIDMGYMSFIRIHSNSSWKMGCSETRTLSISLLHHVSSWRLSSPYMIKSSPRTCCGNPAIAVGSTQTICGSAVPPPSHSNACPGDVPRCW